MQANVKKRFMLMDVYPNVMQNMEERKEGKKKKGWRKKERT